ncbi:MAG: DUF934 domain-containing protein [Burkholderiales bacterium]|nr:DUF934 domain-containing protein [Burkholderiales bacterium]
MGKLIRKRRIAGDSWRLLEPLRDGAPAQPAAPGEPAALPTEGDLIVPLAVWREQRAAIATRAGRTGVLLEAADDPAAIAGDLAALALVAIRFPAFADGRGLSNARLLRERYGYGGELRAVGEVLRDSLLGMERCGFDAFALRADQDAEDALRAFDELTETYQASVTQPQPLFRRRLAAA